MNALLVMCQSELHLASMTLGFSVLQKQQKTLSGNFFVFSSCFCFFSNPSFSRKLEKSPAVIKLKTNWNEKKNFPKLFDKTKQNEKTD